MSKEHEGTKNKEQKGTAPEKIEGGHRGSASGVGGHDRSETIRIIDGQRPHSKFIHEGK